MLSNRRLGQIAIGIVVFAGILVALTGFSLIPPYPFGYTLSTAGALLSLRFSDRALDLIFGPEESPESKTIDPFMKVRYYDEMRKRVEEMVSTDDAKKDLAHFPNALSFIRGLSLIERKNAVRKKLDGAIQLDLDSIYIDHDNGPMLRARGRVEQMMNDAIDWMTLPADAKDWWRVPSIKPEDEPKLRFESPAKSASLSALRGGYSSVIIHLLALEHWTDEWKRLNPPITSREEYSKTHPIIEPPFKVSTKYYLKQSDEQEKGYENTITVEAMTRETQLAIDKMKASIIPAFEAEFPNQLGEVSNTAQRHIEGEVGPMKRTTFYYGMVMRKQRQELALLTVAIKNLGELFPRDESVKTLALALSHEIDFLQKRWADLTNPKFRGLGV